MKKIKIALVGAGFIADYHARALKKLDNVEIAAVVALPFEAAKIFADKYNIEFATSDYKDLLTKKGIDAVIIGTPNKFHAPFAIEFLNNGKDVFLEKPMAINPSEGEKIKEAARDNNQLVMVGHMWRFDDETNFVKNLIQSDEIGKVIKTKGYGIHENWGPDGWFTKKEIAGGGALADMGVHAIDTVRYILGDPKPKEVYAKIGTYYGNYDVDDTGIIMITWDNGTTSIIESGWWQPHMDGPEASTKLFGTKGYVSLFPTEIKIGSNQQNKNKIEIPTFNKTEHCDQTIYNNQMKYFVKCIRERNQPSPGISEGQVVLDIVEAAYESSKTKSVIII
jgi:predicted dehydrogenase